MIRVLFLCTGNSARSQMAEALLRQLGGSNFEVHSAGTVAKGLNPLTIEAMREIDIDVSRQESKSVDRYIDSQWEYVITVCDQAAEACPTFPGAAKRLHWSILDPAAATGNEAERLQTFRQVRDAIKVRVQEFLRTEIRMVGK
ncbi:MAG TPA: arsenate reductase ArsC [Dehalococcoidia bacterium]|nr:arsenate reductase ArsC [Dehalococcoidia bacterium]